MGLMFGGTLKAIAISAALAGVVGAGAGYRYAKRQFDTRAALSEAQEALAVERRAVARLLAEVTAERARAAAAEFMAEEAAAFGSAQLERAAALEGLIDEINAMEGGDRPASDFLLDAIGLR